MVLQRLNKLYAICDNFPLNFQFCCALFLQLNDFFFLNSAAF